MSSLNTTVKNIDKLSNMELSAMLPNVRIVETRPIHEPDKSKKRVGDVIAVNPNTRVITKKES